MKTIERNNHIICYDDYNIEEKPELQALLQEWVIEKLLATVQKEVVVVLGWDGTMLRAIRENYMRNKPFLGVNFWHKWFLLNDRKWIAWENNTFIPREYPLLEIKRNEEILGIGFNDINLYSSTGKLVDIEVQLEWKCELHLKGDGVIISTPAGSTWHGKSYFWPILPHDTESLVITPKGNSTPESPKTISNKENIIIKNAGRKFELWVNLDGVQVLHSANDEEVVLEISKSKKKVELLIAENHQANWDTKVMKEQGFRSNR